MQTITRKGTFDAAHRVLNEKMKCFNLHGHTYLFEICFEFEEMKEIGYAIDFKEIKRVACQFIDDFFDHGMILNPLDKELLQLCRDNNWKYWVMSLNELCYCNPTVENIAREIFLSCHLLLSDQNLTMAKVILYETPNCYTTCGLGDIPIAQRSNFTFYRKEFIDNYKKQKGVLEYDDRK